MTSQLKIAEGLEDDLKIIKEWLLKQLHLPQNIDDQLLRRFILSSDRSLEKTKHIIDLCYTIRSQAPEIFANRNLRTNALINMMKRADILPLPKTTNKNYKLILFRLVDKQNFDYIFSDAVKLSIMLADVRLVSEMDIADGEIPIFDMDGVNLQFLAKVTLPVVRKYMTYTQEAHPVRLKGIHVINTSAILDKVMLLVKPFLKGEVAKLLHFHTSVESLSKYIDLDLLPEEYGGKTSNLTDIRAYWMKKMSDRTDYFLDDTRWKVDESKRPINHENNKSIFGIQGSFRSLNID